MSYVPHDLFAIQSLWHEMLGTPPRPSAILGHGRDSDSYHCGASALRRWGKAPEQLAWGYSVMESGRDRGALTEAASALDLPTPTQALRDVISRVVWLAERGDNRCFHLRRVCWSPDGRLVRRWDDLEPPSLLDDRQHLAFVHLAFYRDGEGLRHRSVDFGGLLAELLAEMAPIVSRAA